MVKSFLFWFGRQIQYMEKYRSGHNEAVLKTVCPKGHMGSNPIFSAELFLQFTII